ncbi:MAG: protein translocase subunit SecD [Pseudomonadota bacterium]
MIRDTFQRMLILAVAVVAAVACLLPSIVGDKFTKEWPTKPLALGLDISGGVHLVYGVQASEAVKSRLQSMLSSVRAKLREKKIAVASGRVAADNSLRIGLLSDLSVEQAKAAVGEFSSDLTFSELTSEDGRPTLVWSISQVTQEKIQREAIEQAVETLRNRVDQFGVAEPLIQRSGENRIILQMPGVSDVNAVKKVVGSVAKLEFRLVPRGGDDAATVTLKDQQGQPITVEDPALMTGDAVDDARVDFDQNGQVEVALRMTAAGADDFARITADNVGRQLAIVLDGVVYSAPVIRSAIAGGQASITGGFSTEEARRLKIVLKAGALPAPLEVLEERTVGPTLGFESVKKGLLAMAIGFVGIALFMVFYYAKSGLVAVFTLALNAFLMMGCLSLFGATLTLPGLAGLALTIGMAVDSNVIIFERIRDELRNGASRDLAVHTGFDKAFGAIFDSNITTLLAGAILYYFGTGPIRGFAVTLSVGIATTLFCAVFVARLCFDYFELKGKKGLSI